MLKIDLHIHSIYSGHAYGTFYDIIREAKEKKMDMIAITDHGPSMVGTQGKLHFFQGKRRPNIAGLRVLWGCETNVADGKGNLDISENIIEKLDIILVGLHGGCAYNDLGKEKNTLAVKRALEHPKVKIFAHPTHCQYDVDYEELIRHAIKHDVLPELDLAYLRHKGEKDFDKFQTLVRIVKKMGAKLICNSDAHFIPEIGDDSILEIYKDRLGLTDDMIINNFPDELREFLEI